MINATFCVKCFFPDFQTLNVLNPMRESPQEVLEDTDLAGPLVFCLIFGGTLLLVSHDFFTSLDPDIFFFI